MPTPVTSPSVETLYGLIRTIPDFPVKGVMFRDITPLLADPQGMRRAIAAMIEPFKDQAITHVVGVEARGFIFGALVAAELDAAFVPVRKQGKLPARTIAQSYELEYGRATLEIHADCFAGQAEPRVLFVDDVLATGGTAAAAIDLARQAGGNVVGAAFLIELLALSGRERLPGIHVHAVLSY